MTKRNIYYVEELYIGRILKIVDDKETISNEKALIYSKDLPKKSSDNLWKKIKLQFNSDNQTRHYYLYPYKEEITPYDIKLTIENDKCYVVEFEKALSFLDDYLLERGYLYEEDMAYFQNKLNGVTENDNLLLEESRLKHEKVVYISDLAYNSLQILEKRFSVRKIEFTQLINYGVQVSAYLTSLGYSVKFENFKDGLESLRLNDMFNVIVENGLVMISFNKYIDVNELEINSYYSNFEALRVLKNIDKGIELQFKHKSRKFLE